MSKRTLSSFNRRIVGRKDSNRPRRYSVFPKMKLTTAALLMMLVVLGRFLLGNSNNENLVTLADLSSLTDDDHVRITSQQQQQQETSYEEAVQARKPLLDLLHQAGLQITDRRVLNRLPRWSQVVDLYGEKPIVIGMETCKRFLQSKSPKYCGVAGQMNVGTNALAKYMSSNLRSSNITILAQVPWHKHGWTALRNVYNFTYPYQRHEAVLPIVIIRHPYFWLHSMCTSPYNMKWKHSHKRCPNLIQKDGSSVPVRIRWGSHRREWQSLVHVWSEWYREYYEADFPRLMIRFEGKKYCARHDMDSLVMKLTLVCYEQISCFIRHMSWIKYVNVSVPNGKSHTLSFIPSTCTSRFHSGNVQYFAHACVFFVAVQSRIDHTLLNSKRHKVEW